VALLAIAVFAISGANIVPDIVASPSSAKVPPEQVTALLLNIALVLFAWKRSVELKRASAERDLAENRAHSLAYYDEVTGLFNRRYLRERIEKLQSADGGKGALILIDLDHFKRVNDIHGHAVGDELLIEAAQKIRAISGPEASCVRLGGDEFAVLLRGAAAREKGLGEMAGKLLAELRRTVRLSNIVTTISASIGIAVLNRKCKDPGSLLKRADVAMYEAKRRGRGTYVFFDQTMEVALARRATLELEILRGIESGEFVPYFQPILDLQSNKVTGFEVLARWNHPERGLLEPLEFIEVAEETGMISELSFAVMFEALSVARKWPGEPKLAVNVSPAQCRDPMVAQRILQVLTDTGFPPARLELELMEKSLLADHDQALALITSLKNCGISVSVDDFGASYTSLTQLKDLPFDRIKIDRTFLAALHNERECDALARAIATVGKGLKVPVTAEGVESQAVREMLSELGCEDAQGWLFSKALSAREVAIGFGDRNENRLTADADRSKLAWQASGAAA
jgi:diguanylate cyclase (GGDEF)-like protein